MDLHGPRLATICRGGSASKKKLCCYKLFFSSDDDAPPVHALPATQTVPRHRSPVCCLALLTLCLELDATCFSQVLPLLPPMHVIVLPGTTRSVGLHLGGNSSVVVFAV